VDVTGIPHGDCAAAGTAPGWRLEACATLFTYWPWFVKVWLVGQPVVERWTGPLATVGVAIGVVVGATVVVVGA